MTILQVLRSGNPEVILDLFFWLPASNSLELSLPANDIRNLTAAQYTHHWHVQLSCHHFSPVFIEKPLNDSLLVSILTRYCPFFNIVAEGDPVKKKSDRVIPLLRTVQLLPFSFREKSKLLNMTCKTLQDLALMPLQCHFPLLCQLQAP